MRFSRQDRGLGDLERALRTERPELDRSVQRGIVDRISASPVRRGGGFRIALAGVMTAGVFGAMAAFGGVSYATNSVQHAVGVSGSNNKGWNYTPSCDQYGHKGKKDDKGRGGNGGYNNPPSFHNGGYGFGGFGGFRW